MRRTVAVSGTAHVESIIRTATGGARPPPPVAVDLVTVTLAVGLDQQPMYAFEGGARVTTWASPEDPPSSTARQRVVETLLCTEVLSTAGQQAFSTRECRSEHAHALLASAAAGEAHAVISRGGWDVDEVDNATEALFASTDNDGPTTVIPLCGFGG